MVEENHQFYIHATKCIVTSDNISGLQQNTYMSMCTNSTIYSVRMFAWFPRRSLASFMYIRFLIHPQMTYVLVPSLL